MPRDKHYPNRTIRLSDEVWEQLKVAQKQSGKSWNQFIKLNLPSQEENKKHI
jgi:predicted HicB family RNase H-like nuclease